MPPCGHYRANRCCRSTQTHKNPLTHKDTQILTPRIIQSHNTTSEQLLSSLKQAEPWSFILLFLIKIFSGGDVQRKWRHSPINQSINCYEICICLNMEFDSIKAISRTISLCKHLRRKEGGRERGAECGWGSLRGGNTPPRVARCVYSMRFNWIVLHQCWEVSWCVCRGLCSLWLRAWLSFFPPQQANTWLETKSSSGFNHRQSVTEEVREVVGTSRQIGNIRTPLGLVLKVPKLHNNNSSNGSAGYF